MNVWIDKEGDEKEEESISQAVFSNDSRYICVVKRANEACVLEVDTLSVLSRLCESSTHTITCAIFSPDSSYIITGTDEGDIAKWETQTGEKVGHIGGACVHASRIFVDDTAQWVVCTSLSGSAAKWDLNSGEKVRVYDGGHTEAIVLACVSWEKQVLVTTGLDSKTVVWSLL
uniref:Guanine nucleotide-binding protein subunit beta-like protein n=1 Tax=Palpitomonas bilix TaxID=652834 RepID=A0A7S3CWK8_9EUKA